MTDIRLRLDRLDAVVAALFVEDVDITDALLLANLGLLRHSLRDRNCAVRSQCRFEGSPERTDPSSPLSLSSGSFGGGLGGLRSDMIPPFVCVEFVW